LYINYKTATIYVSTQWPRRIQSDILPQNIALFHRKIMILWERPGIYGYFNFSLEISPDVGLLRSIFSKHYMSSNRVTDADGLLSACASWSGH
jgi:hypothetical protein